MSIFEKIDVGGTIQGYASVAVIVARHWSNGNSAAITNGINYTPPPNYGTYRLNARIQVSSWTTPASFTCVSTFTDLNGVARTVTMTTFESDGTLSALIDEVEYFNAVPLYFQIDNSATAITFSTSGTFTGTVSYTAAATLEYLGYT
jgi:hypothetical protein